MKKYVCTVCGYIAEGSIPEQCPVCKAPASAFVEKTGNTYVTEHVVGILLNAILPGNDYEFDSADGADAPSSGNLQV